MKTEFYSCEPQYLDQFKLQKSINGDSLDEIIQIIEELWNDYSIVVVCNERHTIYADKENSDCRVKIRIGCIFKL